MGRVENLEDYDVPPLGIVCPDPVRTDIYRKKFGRYKEYYDGCKAGGNKQWQIFRQIRLHNWQASHFILYLVRGEPYTKDNLHKKVYQRKSTQIQRICNGKYISALRSTKECTQKYKRRHPQKNNRNTKETTTKDNIFKIQKIKHKPNKYKWRAASLCMI